MFGRGRRELRLGSGAGESGIISRRECQMTARASEGSPSGGGDGGSGHSHRQFRSHLLGGK